MRHGVEMDIHEITKTSKNFDSRKNTDGSINISMLVLHYTGMVSAKAALDKLCDPNSKVSAHLLIDEEGTVYRLVDDEYRAWHAGIAYWKNHRDINSCSIGIELVNPGHDIGYTLFPRKQINSLISISKLLQDKYKILPQNIVGHSDIAPSRKIDPGEFFPWEELSEYGLGLWPHSKGDGHNSDDIFHNLSKIGYADPNNSALGADTLKPKTAKNDVLMAFQRHYLPQNMSGLADTKTKHTIESILSLLFTEN